MKKKVKLITTIASLGLALALMAFGVYAALTVNFRVTSQVSFTAAPNVNVQFTAAVAKTGSATLGTEGVESKTYNTYTDGGFDSQDAKTFETIALKDVTLVAAGDTCTYTFTVANYSEFEVTVTITETDLPEGLKVGETDYVTVTENVATFDLPAYNGNIENSTVSQTILVTLVRTDRSYTLGGVDLGFSVTKKAPAGN